jgi:hypothetical protein
VASPAALKALREALAAEQARRQARLGAESGDPRERLLAELDQMAERMRAAPGWVEPTAEERAEHAREVERWFEQRFGKGRG